MNTTNNPTTAITYHIALDDVFNDWAAELGYTPHRLRLLGETAIRTRHDEATIKHPADMARDKQPDIYSLCLGHGSLEVIYTVEPHAIVIRGYGWDVTDTRDDFDGGGFYCDNDWVLSPAQTSTDVKTERTENVDVFGGCPYCRGNDGFLNLGRDHWFTCNVHRVKWCIDSNWFRCWREETEAEWASNATTLADYREVEPVFS